MDFAAIRATIRARALYAGLILVVAGACVAIVGTDAWHTWERRSETIDDDKAATANLVRSLAQHAHDVVQSVDTAVLALRAVGELDGVNVQTFGRLDQLMQAEVAALPVVRVIAILGPTGQYVGDSLVTHQPSLNGSERSYFQYHASHPDRGVRLDGPVHSKIDGTWIVTVSRRIDAPDGSFAGVVVGTISVDAIQSFYATFDMGAQGVIALLSDQGILIARKPDDNLLVGTSLAKGKFFKAAQQGGDTGSFEFVSSVNGIDRLGSYQRVDGFPLLIVAAHGLDEILAPWRHAAFFHLAVSSAIAAGTAILGLLLSRQVRRRLVVEAALEVKERHYQMLAENSSDLVIQLDTDLRRIYVSPTSATLLGYDPGDLIARPLKDIVHVEDWPALSASLAETGPGGTITPVSYRIRKWNNTQLWVEATGRRLAGNEGYILTVRDITQRRAADALLQESNQQLQRLVMVDALTTVGNKQSFDLAFGREYARVERSDTAISLLIVDLDHFNLFNDRFGPIAGDGCLRLLAAEIRGCLSHSSDSVARLGDDEFVVLLPETDRQEAVRMAEKICEAARMLNVFPSDPVLARRISVSIGVATVWPRRQAIGPQSLIYATDEALTVAKAAGRDGWHESAVIADYLPTVASQEEEPTKSVEDKSLEVESLSRPAA